MAEECERVKKRKRDIAGRRRRGRRRKMRGLLAEKP